jgi:hypothetical protein
MGSVSAGENGPQWEDAGDIEEAIESAEEKMPEAMESAGDTKSVDK